MLRRRIAEAGFGPVLTDAELRASRHGFLDGADLERGLWVFAYGSLLWNPAFHVAERRCGMVFGHHPRFCLWVHLGRGTADNPGLMLGLEPGGSCHGAALRIAADRVESETEVIWLREMVTDAYLPRWVTVRTPAGPARAVAFVINRRHPRYSGPLPEDRLVRALATASGELGSSAAYLAATVEQLDRLGIRESALHRLERQVLAAATAPAGRRG